ncbi:MAG: hypothetical protein HYW48_07330 [Deltaproteobacteria bacterium]|nr:hypothetical protein [Deltaproteobacteria bacterium]
MRKVKATVLASTLLLGANLAAQDLAATQVAATKEVAPLQTVFPNAYGKFNLRHYQVRELAKSGDLKSSPFFQGRLTLGSKFFQKALDSRFVFGANNKYGEGEKPNLVTDRGTRWENEYTVFSNDNFEVIPYFYAYLPYAGKGFNSDLGTYLGANYKVNTPVGTLKLEATYEGETALASRTSEDDQVALRDRNGNPGKREKNAGFTLTSPEEADKVDPAARKFAQELTSALSYAPSVVSGLSVGARTYWTTSFAPIMQLDEQNNVVTKTTGGSFDRVAYTRNFKLKHEFFAEYKITDTLKLENSFYVKEAVKDTHAWENVLSLTSNLF